MSDSDARDQRLPREWIHLPLGQARSMGIHESQSVSFKMQLGRSRPFLQLIAPLVRKHLGDGHHPPLRRHHEAISRAVGGDR